MKKVLLMFVAGAFLSLSVTSCKNCGHCGPGGTKICKGDADYETIKLACGPLWVAE